MQRVAVGLVVLLLMASAVFAAPRRIAFMRTVPPPHDLGQAERIAVIYAIGDSDKIETFVDIFVHATNRAGTLQVDETAITGRNLAGARIEPATLKRLQRTHPADAYLGVNRFTCTTEQGGAEVSTRDTTGERIKRRRTWYDATCRARIDAIDAATGKRMFSYEAAGQGTSPRVADLSEEERNIALEQAARYAAISAAEGITPRRVRESVELDDSAPEFDSAMAMVDASRMAEAREIWEKALQRHRNSAALHYNLGAVNEALGDVGRARLHYMEASKLSPDERRYRAELQMFKRRYE